MYSFNIVNIYLLDLWISTEFIFSVWLKTYCTLKFLAGVTGFKLQTICNVKKKKKNRFLHLRKFNVPGTNIQWEAKIRHQNHLSTTFVFSFTFQLMTERNLKKFYIFEYFALFLKNKYLLDPRWQHLELKYSTKCILKNQRSEKNIKIIVCDNFVIAVLTITGT